MIKWGSHKSWELYRYAATNDDVNTLSFMGILEGISIDGWELVTVVSTISSENEKLQTFYFKRPK